MSENNRFTEKAVLTRQGSAGAVQILHLVCGIIATLSIIFAAVCFAYSCIDIYKSGDVSPFTKESISSHFQKISIPTFIAIGTVLIGALVAFIFPLTTSLGKIYNPYIPLKSYKSRLDLSLCDGEIADDIRLQRRRRGFVRLLFTLICVALLGAALMLSLDFSQYLAKDINGEILGCVIISLPASITALLSLFVGELFASMIASYELDLTKWAVTRRSEALGKMPPKKTARGAAILLNLFRVVVFAIGVTFVILGVMNGGMEQVLGKAVRICTECIGLG